MSPLPTEWVPRWLVCLMDPLVDTEDRVETDHAIDPLVDTEDRVETDHAIAAIVAAQPRWWAAYISGLIADLLATLDPEDPWRSLRIEGARVLFDDADGGDFGGWLGLTDLVRPIEEDLRADPHLASARKPLDRTGALLVAHATMGREPAYRFLLREIGPTNVLDPVRADDLFSSTGRALRLVHHRRREYVGYEDPFLRIDGRLWLGRADGIVAGEALDEGRIATGVDANRVLEGRYRMFSGEEDGAAGAGEEGTGREGERP